MSIDEHLKTICEISDWVKFGQKIENAARQFESFNASSAEDLMAQIAQHRRCTLSSVKNTRRTVQFLNNEFPEVKSAQDIICGQAAVFELSKLFKSSSKAAHEIAPDVFTKKLRVEDIREKRKSTLDTPAGSSDTAKPTQDRHSQIKEFENKLNQTIEPYLSEILGSKPATIEKMYRIEHILIDLKVTLSDGTIALIDYKYFTLNRALTQKERLLGYAALMLRFSDNFLIIVNAECAETLDYIRIAAEKLELKGFGMFAASFEKNDPQLIELFKIK